MTNKTDNWNIYVWKIENFSYCWHKRTECISSPNFCIEGASWQLQIFPRGSKTSDYISCYLKRSTYASYELKFKLLCIDPDGKSLVEWISTDGTFFKRNKTDGYEYFAKRSDVFAKERMKFLPNDTLTVCCHISFSGNYYTGVREILARTSIEVNCETFGEKISGFSFHYNVREITVPSATFGKNILKINFSEGEGSCCDENLFIEIFCKNNEQRKFSTCNVFILDAAGVKLKCGKSDIWFEPSKTDQTWKFPLIFTKWELIAKSELYLPDDTLSLQFEFSSSMGIAYEVTENVRSKTIFNSAYSVIASDSVKESSALEVLGNLFRENILCDVNLHTSTKTFPAHKAILSARSSVFKVMFTSDMKEKKSNRVDIEDLEDETVHRLLLYIYTNTVENLQWQAASQLYVAADKYSVESLKNKCSSILERNLSVSNVGEILELADRHQDVHIKNSVVDYISRNNKAVIESDEWKDFELKNSQLTSETIRNVYRKAIGF